MALVPIEGAPPSLIDPPQGCRFAARCPFVEPACTAAPPPMLGDDHRAACWRSDAAADLRALAAQPATWLAA